MPGDEIVGYLGRGEGLVVHRSICNVAKRLQHKDSERFITVDWSEEPSRLFEACIVVTVQNGKGVLARLASELANAEADIVHVDMDDEAAMGTVDLRLTIKAHDQAHIENVLRNLRRTPSVLRTQRVLPQ